MIDFILASGSPRRKELLEQVGMTFRIEAAHGEEIITRTEPSEIVEELSFEKASEVADRVSSMGVDQKTVVIGADTIVVYQGQIMGKPKDAEDAVRMLTMLQGEVHQVFTGVTFIVLDGHERVCNTFYEKTDVTMYPMSEQQIRDYAATGEPMDKAGSYAIQGRCAAYIKGIQGEYVNVVGLPVARLLQELMKVGITI